MILTYRYRVKDGSSGTRNALLKQARAVNYVWNYLCDIQRHAMKWHRRWPSYYDLTKLTAGSSKEIGLHSETILAVCRQFVISRDSVGHCPRFRGARSLPWVPFSHGYDAIKRIPSGARFMRRKYRLWVSREIPDDIRSGSFGCDARGRWYLNLACEVEPLPATGKGEVGIDLGLKYFATLSDGTNIQCPKLTRVYADELARAQRAGNTKRTKAIHAKITNSRKDFLHKLSTKLARKYQMIVVGNVSASSLKQTNMAKSVSDAGWTMFRNMLAYKAAKHQACFIEAEESFTSRTCSDCGSISGPKGRKGLDVRQWECVECGSVHCRDRNAAINILKAGTAHRPLVGEIAA